MQYTFYRKETLDIGDPHMEQILHSYMQERLKVVHHIYNKDVIWDQICFSIKHNKYAIDWEKFPIDEWDQKAIESAISLLREFKKFKELTEVHQ